MAIHSFDAHDRNSWYFGAMSRQETNELLIQERDNGVFLVRDSNSIAGDYVLCVKENTKVSHYIINKVAQHTPSLQTVYRIGDHSFADLPELLEFYKIHYLDTTVLIRPAQRRVEKVIAKFDFDGSDADDLPFRKNEILYVVSKDEEQWWTARNSLGHTGQIPVPYVQKLDENQTNSGNGGGVCGGGGGGNTLERSINNGAGNLLISTGKSSPHQSENTLKKSNLNRKLPALARVKQARVPNAYDKTALKLEVGDVITVTKTNINGQWEGELRGKVGHFPFTHVEFIEQQDSHHHHHHHHNADEWNTTE